MLFCNEIFILNTTNVSQTVTYYDVLYWNLLYVVCLVCMSVGGRVGVNLDFSWDEVFYIKIEYLVSMEQGYILTYRILEN